MAKVQFQVDGLDANQTSIFNQDVSFDLDVTVDGNVILPGLSEGFLTVGADGTVSSTTSGSTYLAPTIGSTLISSGATVGTIAGLTLTTPTIGSFTNSNHSHTDSIGGGTLTSSAISDFAEAAQDAIGLSIGTGLTYTDSTGEIKVTPNTYDTYGSASTVAGDLSIHLSDTTAHGTTGDVVGTSDTQTLTNKTLTSPKINEDVMLTATATELNILDGATLSTTELNYVDGVTSGIQNQIDGKMPKSGGTFTGTVYGTSLELSGDLTVNGTYNSVPTETLTVTNPIIYMGDGNPANVNDIGFVGSHTVSSVYSHTGLVRDASANTWKLFDGVTDEPTTTINFAQGSLDNLAVGSFSATSITVGDVSNAEFGYLNGVTSAIQTQLDSKLSTSTASSTYQVIVSGVSDTEIGYLDGVTSSIQTQLNSKLSSSDPVNFGGYVTEQVTVSATAASSTINYNLITNKNILYYTSNASGNWTLNLRGDGSTTLNSIMSVGQALTIVFMATNGSTAYYQTGLQIDGTAVTPKWQGGAAPTGGNASSIDIYNITVIKTATDTYTVLENLSKFA